MNRPTLEKLKFRLNKKKNYYSVKAASTDISGKVVIPNVYKGKSVSEIEDYAFVWCSNVKSIVIPGSIISIGDSAFSDCLKLKSIVVPRSIVFIGTHSFINCSSLESITIPEGLKTIKRYSFQGCLSLKTVEIPESVNNIEEGAFIHCSSLQNVAISSNVDNIGEHAFSYCSSLKAIMVDEKNPVFSSYDGVLFNKERSNLICFPCGYEKPYSIPNSVLSTGDSAFSGNVYLDSVIIPKSVVSIGSYAFSHCKNLKTVTVMCENITIQSGAFSDCESLTTFFASDRIKYIGYNAFGNCPLKSVVIPFVGETILKSDFLESIFGISTGYDPKEHYFYTSGGIPNTLEKIIIGNGYISIENDAFEDLPYFASISIFVPASVISIGDETFNHSSSIKSIVVHANNPVYCSIDGKLVKKSKKLNYA